MEILVKAAQLLLSLSILVVLHELGHFIPAKLFKTRVEKFYLFFDPWFSLFKVKKGGTEYGIGWLPLGGYVKIAGMIDESMDKEQMKSPPQPWEFRSKPAWQRLIIMIGGVTVNVILGIILYIMVLFTWGTEYLPVENMTHGIYADSTAQTLGFQSGDKIISVGGEKIKKFSETQMNILLEDDKNVVVERNGSLVDLPISKSQIAPLIDKQSPFLYVGILPIIDSISPETGADKAGLKKGDLILSVNGIETKYYYDVSKEISKRKDEEISVVISRNNETMEILAKTNEDGKLGFRPVPTNEQLKFEIQTYSFLESIPGGIRLAYSKFDNYIKQMKLIFQPETGAYKSLGGFMTIANAFDGTWNWELFWNFTAFLSIILAIMNLLPIPALDGGHIIFLLYEMIVGKPAPEKFMEYAQIVGIVLLLSLMLLANGNDFYRYIFK